MQINVKVQNIYNITARPTGPEETRVSVQVSVSLSCEEYSSEELFSVHSSFLWRIGLIWLKIIATIEPRNEHNKGEPTKTTSWLPQVP